MKRKNIIHAINTKNFTRLKKLITNNDESNVSNNVGETSCILASRYGKVQFLKYLLKYDVNLEATTYHTINYVIRDFQNEFNFINSYENTALWWASRNGHLEIVKILCKHEAKVNFCKKGSSPLMEACRHGHIDIVKLLVYYKADVNYYCFDKHDFDYSFPLKEAVRFKYKNIVYFLLKNEASYENKYCTISVFESSAVRRYNNIFKILVDKMIADGRFYMHRKLLSKCLIIAVRSGSATIVEYLLNQDIDINIQDIEGNTSLMEAVENKNIKIINLLLEKKADVNIKNNEGKNVNALEIIDYLRK